MSGHSKWATIKRKKAKIDAQKGASFARYSREILVAAKMGGINPESNFRLRSAIDKARASGLPNDNIKRLLEKAAGAAESANFEDINYEGYGPGGVAILIEAVTDNRNRTAGDIRSYFNKNNGNLAETGCVGWIFKEFGVISIAKNNIHHDELFEVAINAGADDFAEEEEEYKIMTNPDMLQSVAESIEKEGYILKTVEVTRIPQNIVSVEEKDDAKYLLRLLDSIETHDDVQNLWANFDISDEILEELS
jgi:YebC/PmpR family DNA-binding regulatory protein